MTQSTQVCRIPALGPFNSKAEGSTVEMHYINTYGNNVPVVGCNHLLQKYESSFQSESDLVRHKASVHDSETICGLKEHVLNPNDDEEPESQRKLRPSATPITPSTFDFLGLGSHLSNSQITDFQLFDTCNCDPPATTHYHHPNNHPRTSQNGNCGNICFEAAPTMESPKPETQTPETSNLNTSPSVLSDTSSGDANNVDFEPGIRDELCWSDDIMLNDCSWHTTRVPITLDGLKIEGLPGNLIREQN